MGDHLEKGTYKKKKKIHLSRKQRKDQMKVYKLPS
jgi:hypothetical protein